ncbi:MAG: hypothetical protein A2885_20645 [Sphingopyxis sp. RIFCSPHIGHO2_01_FULL_65_24]|nr:MAG: hypothetical protein A2885_20645 [Sphingopyxis sp. RIFCSPHIGHO2_01_FULL_65_24]
MGDHHRIFAIPLLAAPLAACIPVSAPPQRPAPPVVTTPASPSLADNPLGYDDVSGGDSKPTWVLQPVAAKAREVPASLYTVRPGDTLRAIGEMTHAGSEAIAMENDLAPPYTLVPGQRLRIPAGLYHRVAAGETGIGIAHAYGADWGEIVTINALAEPYILRVGQRLRLPADARPLSPKQVDVATRAAAFSLDIDDIATGSQPALAANKAPAAASAAPRKPVTAAIATPAAFTGRFVWPVPGKVIAKFGPLAPGKVNQGINIATPAGTPIHAVANGVVSYAGDQIAVYGGLILIDHGGGWVSAYGHAQQLDVRRGQSVKAGDVIGLVGATGQVQTPQLHFQLRKNRIPVDPLKQLPAR